MPTSIGLLAVMPAIVLTVACGGVTGAMPAGPSPVSNQMPMADFERTVSLTLPALVIFSAKSRKIVQAHRVRALKALLRP